MTSYPITDPAEIAKLPNGYYLDVCGEDFWCKDGDVWSTPASDEDWDAEDIDAFGGIAARLVPEGEAEAQRDRAVELLRLVSRSHPFMGRFRLVLIEVEDFLAEQPCQRCGGEGWEDTKDYDDLGPMVYKPCSDCQGGAS